MLIARLLRSIIVAVDYYTITGSSLAGGTKTSRHHVEVIYRSASQVSR